MTMVAPSPAPDEPDPSDLSRMLSQWDPSDPAAQAKLMNLIYPELRRMAEFRMRRERHDHTLQPTALVNEFFIHLARQKNIEWKGRAHFMAVASKAMRRLLVDYARGHNSEKRGGGLPKIELERADAAVPRRSLEVAEVDRLIDRLSSIQPRLASVVELRCFGGLTHREIGEVLGVDERTVKRDWKLALAWFYTQLGGNNDAAFAG